MGCTNSTEKGPKDKRKHSNAPQDYPDQLSPPEIKITETDSDRRSSSSSNSDKKGKEKYRKNSEADKDDSNEAHSTEGVPVACVKMPEPELIACDFKPTVEEAKTADDQNDVTANETSDDKPPETEKSTSEEAPVENSAPESDNEENQTTEDPE